MDARTDNPADALHTEAPFTVAAINARYRSGEARPADIVRMVYACIRRDARPGVWINLKDETQALADAAQLAGRAPDVCRSTAFRSPSKTTSMCSASPPPRHVRPLPMTRPHQPRACAGSKPPARSASARPTSINLPPACAACARPTAPAARPTTRTSSPVARAQARRSQWRCTSPSRSVPTPAAPVAFRPRSTASSA